MPGVKLQFEDAQTDIGCQLNQVQNFISSNVDAIIVNPADTASTDKITATVTAAGIPLVYVNRAPNRKELPANIAVVASNHITSGRFEMEELCKQMNGEGNLVILMAEWSARVVLTSPQYLAGFPRGCFNSDYGPSSRSTRLVLPGSLTDYRLYPNPHEY